MARHVAHALLALALALEWLALPGAWLAVAWPLTLLGFVAIVGWLVVSPRTQVFVPTVYRAPAPAAAVAFTFDDGPDPTWTPRVLEILAAHEAKATFFVVGERALAHPDLVARIAREGHEIACHGHTHAFGFHFWSARRMARDIARGQEALVTLLGRASPWFRPPQGIRVPHLHSALDRLPVRPRCVTWSARGLDSRPTTAPRIEARLAPAVRAGSILTLHDGTGFGGGTDRAPTLVALGSLLTTARARGLRCVGLSDLFGASP